MYIAEITPARRRGRMVAMVQVNVVTGMLLAYLSNYLISTMALGDVVWISFNPQAGHEQAGHRPALVLSPQSYNRKVGLVLLCPITNQIKGYPFEVRIPAGGKVSGVVLSDQGKSMDWEARGASLLCSLPEKTVREVLSKIGVLLDA
jgi:mRNA interferase MazF